MWLYMGHVQRNIQGGLETLMLHLTNTKVGLPVHLIRKQMNHKWHLYVYEILSLVCVSLKAAFGQHIIHFIFTLNTAKWTECRLKLCNICKKCFSVSFCWYFLMIFYFFFIYQCQSVWRSYFSVLPLYSMIELTWEQSNVQQLTSEESWIYFTSKFLP